MVVKKIGASRRKPKIAIIGLTYCEGCQFAMLDKGKRFLDWLAKCDVGEFRLVEDLPMKEKEQYDFPDNAKIIINPKKSVSSVFYFF